MSNYSSAAQLGLVNEETIAWDAEVQAGGARIPRANDAAPGQWTVVARAPPPIPPPRTDGGEVDEEEVVPTFKSFKRERIAQFEDDLYDPGAIQIKRARNGEPVVKRESETPALPSEPEPAPDVEPEPAGPRLALPTMHFGTRYAGTAALAEPAADADVVDAKIEADSASPAPAPLPVAASAPAPVDEGPVEAPAPPAPSLFKKRRGGNSAPRRPIA